MDKNVKRMLKLIEEDGLSLAKKAELCKQTRPDLIAKIEEFNSMHQSLVDCYGYLTAELSKSIPSEFQTQGGADDSESGYGPDSLLLTPDQKLGFGKAGNQVPSVSSHGGSSDLSLKEGSESFSSSSLSSDSESDSFNSSGNAYYSLPLNTDRSGLHKKIIELGTELPSMEAKLRMDEEERGDRMLNEEEKKDYEDLLSRVIGYEEELRVTKQNLQLSEDEVARLKGELQKSEFFGELAGTLQTQLESALRDIQAREADLEVERRRVLELQKKIDQGTHKLEGQLKLAEEEITMMKAKIHSENRQVLDLQETIKCYENDLSDRNHELKTWKDALLNAQEKFSLEKAQLQCEICNLSEKLQNIWEVQRKALEDKLRQCEAEIAEIKSSYDAKEIGLQMEISQLKAELIDRGGHVEVLNKTLDGLKFKYDMLMADKDGMSAKANTLLAEANSRENQIRQMEEHLRRLNTERVELIAGSERSRKQEGELRFKVLELEKEVERQRAELSAGAEEKREAIRQLCFSLDHYRSGYKELREAFLGHKRHAVVAS